MRAIPRMIPTIILLMATAIAPFPSQAADQSDAQAPVANKRKWTLSINGGLTLNSGNTRSRLYNGEVAFAIALDGFELDTEADILYGKSSAEVVQDRGRWNTNFSRSLGSRVNIFGQVVLEYDNITGIDHRTTAGLGLRVDLIETPKIQARLTSSVNSEFLDSRDSSAIAQSLRMRISMQSTINISDTTRFKAEFLYTPDLAAMARDYRLEGSISLSVLMKKPVWLTVRLEDRYNNAPASISLQKNDFTLINAIEIRF